MGTISGRAIAAAGVATFTLVAITTVTIIILDGGRVSRTPDESRAHGEKVFRLQNTVLDELIGATDDTGLWLREVPALVTAEDEIVESCRDLNEAASLSAGGEKPGLLLQMRVLDSMSRCEASAVAVKALLDDRTIFNSTVLP
jgi:hypothetical protein